MNVPQTLQSTSGMGTSASFSAEGAEPSISSIGALMDMLMLNFFFGFGWGGFEAKAGPFSSATAGADTAADGAGAGAGRAGGIGGGTEAAAERGFTNISSRSSSSIAVLSSRTCPVALG